MWPWTEAGFFARAALLEASSIEAFHELAFDLGAHGAPGRLIRAALTAANDERRHSRTMRRLARRAGWALDFSTAVGPPRTRVAPTLSELAQHNAVEGCVGETWGAVVAALQGTGAKELPVRRAMAAISRDETRHAELAWRIASWAEPRLGRAPRAAVRDARAQAFAEVRKQALLPIPPGLDALGLPAPQVAAAVLGAIGADLRLELQRS